MDRSNTSPLPRDTRAALIRRGVERYTEQGFNITSIDDILKSTSIPKGSFYHFFPTKRDYGLAVIDAYAQYFDLKLDRILSDTARTPVGRLAEFVHDAERGMTRHAFNRGCLVGNLGQEFGPDDRLFREKLDAVVRGWESRVALCLQAGIAAGELSAATEPGPLAEFFWASWEGAILRAKLTRNAAPIRRFSQTFFVAILGLSGVPCAAPAE